MSSQPIGSESGEAATVIAGPEWARCSLAAMSEVARPGGIVIAGVDATASGRGALRVAADLAKGLGSALHGVHVPPRLPVLWSLSAELIARAPEWREDLETEAFFDTAAAADRVGVGWSFTVERGDVPTVLLQEARRCEAALVVVAADVRHSRPHRCHARRLAALSERPVLFASPVSSRDGSAGTAP